MYLGYERLKLEKKTNCPERNKKRATLGQPFFKLNADRSLGHCQV
jgi:hypothetical protein